jgi:hypothetical protein
MARLIGTVPEWVDRPAVTTGVLAPEVGSEYRESATVACRGGGGEAGKRGGKTSRDWVLLAESKMAVPVLPRVRQSDTPR